MLASSSVDLEPQAIGRYDLLLELGRGGMAVLHLARARGVGGFSKLFAIKQILPHLAVDPPFVDMFLNEGRIAARLSHPNLCPVFELGSDRGELYMVMEYLDGVPWDALSAAMPLIFAGVLLLILIVSFRSRAVVFCQYLEAMTGIRLKPSDVRRVYREKGRNGVRELFLDLIIREDLKEGPIDIPDEEASEQLSR